MAMVYLLGVVLVARKYGFWTAALTSVMSVLAFDFFIVPPVFSFLTTQVADAVMLVMMLTIALIVSNLTADLRLQAETAQQRERRASVLYAFTGDLTGAQKVEAD